jgi:hypothetical protein
MANKTNKEHSLINRCALYLKGRFNPCMDGLMSFVPIIFFVCELDCFVFLVAYPLNKAYLFTNPSNSLCSFCLYVDELIINSYESRWV